MFIAAYCEKSSEMFLIELPKPKSLDVMNNFMNDCNLLVDNLDIIKNRLVILNPNRKRATKGTKKPGQKKTKMASP